MSPTGVLLALWSGVLLSACTTPQARADDPLRYRLAGSGSHWDVVGDDRVVDDLLPRYPEFFAVVLDPARTDEADLLPLRDDLEAEPVTRSNYDALNAVAVGYFELNHRGEVARRGQSAGGVGFLTSGFRAAHLLGVPWRAYGEIEDAALRDAILDFFEDAASGTKLATARTVGRLEGIVGSLAPKEPDPDRAQRIEALVAEIRTRAAAVEREDQAGRSE
ncbi:MAG: hypothetical protein ACR2PQ_00065 [Myxococcota bacterium]